MPIWSRHGLGLNDVSDTLSRVWKKSINQRVVLRLNLEVSKTSIFLLDESRSALVYLYPAGEVSISPNFTKVSISPNFTKVSP